MLLLFSRTFNTTEITAVCVNTFICIRVTWTIFILNSLPIDKDLQKRICPYSLFIIISELYRYEKFSFSVALGYGDVQTSWQGEGKVQVREDVQGGNFWGCGKSSLSGLIHSIYIKMKYGLSCISSQLFSE